MKTAEKLKKVGVPTPKRRMKTISSSRKITSKPVPRRSCVGCRQIKTKREMVRLFRNSRGEVEIDLTGKREGRGAYLCRDRACWEKALNSKQLEHALKGKINQENIERLGKVGGDLFKELNIG